MKKTCTSRIIIALGILLALTACKNKNSAPTTDSPTQPKVVKTVKPKVYNILPSEQSISIDGVIDDQEWGMHEWTSSFVDIEGDIKPHPSLDTRVKMTYDQQNLYIVCQMEEPHVISNLKEKNKPVFLYDSNFEVFIDPDGDAVNYYEFEVNADNVIWELSLPKPYRVNGSPRDPHNLESLISATKVYGTMNNHLDIDTGWNVEMAIPWCEFEQFGTNGKMPQTGTHWRLNFSRVEWLIDVLAKGYQKQEGKPEQNWVWSPTCIINMHVPERWGILAFGKVDTNKIFQEIQIQQTMSHTMESMAKRIEDKLPLESQEYTLDGLSIKVETFSDTTYLVSTSVENVKYTLDQNSKFVISK